MLNQRQAASYKSTSRARRATFVRDALSICKRIVSEDSKKAVLVDVPYVEADHLISVASQLVLEGGEQLLKRLQLEQPADASDCWLRVIIKSDDKDFMQLCEPEGIVRVEVCTHDGKTRLMQYDGCQDLHACLRKLALMGKAHDDIRGALSRHRGTPLWDQVRFHFNPLGISLSLVPWH